MKYNYKTPFSCIQSNEVPSGTSPLSLAVPEAVSKAAILGLSVLAASILPGAALAEQSLFMEEVVVSAQKRDQNLQDVSVAVTAFSGDAIEKMGFQEGLDITQQVPNMDFFAIFGEASSPSISLRGISLVNFSDSWESPVSMYVDDVYRGNPAGSAMQLFDLERVEVLRGPQGTIYGRNTTGGLVHYISKSPTDELEASASVRIGSYSEKIAEAAIGGALGDGIRGRLAVRQNTNDGWQTNTVTGEKVNNTDSFGYRAKVEFDLGEDASLLLTINGSKADQKTVGFAHMGYLETATVGAAKCSIARIQNGECTSNTFGMTGAEAVSGQFDPEHIASSTPGLATQIDTFGASAKLTWEFGDVILTSITAYEELDKFLQDDGDGTSVVWFDEQYSVDAEQYTQELRLNGSADEIQWVAGAYYYKDDRGLVTEAPTTLHGLWHQEVVTLDTESWAVFGQVEYDLSQTLTLLAGARFTTEERDFTLESGPSFYTPLSVVDDISDDAVTGRIGLDWRPSDDTLVYASYSTGYKSGGFSGSYNATLAATKPVDSENVASFELGLKTTLADGRVRLNLAAFAYEVEDFQTQVFISVEDGSVITNAGDVTGKGLEAELTASVTDNFEVIVGMGLLDTEFSSDLGFAVAGDDYTLDGNELPSAPGLNYNLVARYYVDLEDWGEVVFQADYSWKDEHFLQIENDPYSHHDSYGLANAKVAWESTEGNYTVEAFVENLSNEEYFTYQNTLGSDWGYAVWGKPRVAGVRFAWKM